MEVSQSRMRGISKSRSIQGRKLTRSRTFKFSWVVRKLLVFIILIIEHVSVVLPFLVGGGGPLSVFTTDICEL